MKKYYFFLIAALLFLTSCAQEPGMVSMPMSYIPIGVQILAYIGFATVVLLAIGFIVVFGGILEYFRDRDED